MSQPIQVLTEIRGAPNLAPSFDRYSCEIVDEPGTEWDRLAGDFADMGLEQTAAFAGSRFGAARPAGILLREANNADPVAMALAVVATLPVVGFGLAYVKRELARFGYDIRLLPQQIVALLHGAKFMAVWTAD